MKYVCNGKNDCGLFQDEDLMLCNASRGNLNAVLIFTSTCVIMIMNPVVTIKSVMMYMLN